MPLAPTDLKRIHKHLGIPTNRTDIMEQLKLGIKKQISDKYHNFDTIKWWLKSVLLVGADADGVRKVAEAIVERSEKKVFIEVAPPPPINVDAEKTKILRDGAHTKAIQRVHVQLDKNQLKHQPKEHPIGDRTVGGGEKFGTYASKAWHEENTMRYMAQWAIGLGDIPENTKSEHGQSKRINIGDLCCCFEGYCVRLGDTKYVSFHCYPNSRS